MKTKCVGPVVILVLFALCNVSAHADTASYSQVIKDREAVLSKIVAIVNERYAVGSATVAELNEAQGELEAFHLESAPTIAEKIAVQESTVKRLDNFLAEIKVRRVAGLVTDIDVLKATDYVLKQKQLLEALKLSAAKV